MMTPFQKEITQGLPEHLPAKRSVPGDVNRAPKRKDILSAKEKKLALENALRYFPAEWHEALATEFLEELKEFGRIYMYRMHARPIEDYPCKTPGAAAIMLMIQNNLDPAVAQHPEELITYGGNGAVFQNWAQYLLTMKYLSEMTEEQTLHMYSGHPMGLFPSSKEAPRVVVTNGMMIPNYSQPDDWEKFNALGVTQYGQMTAGSYMYIGPQGIVHGTTITVLNAARMKSSGGPEGKLFVTAGLGGMSGAQPKAGNIAGVVSITAEINPKAAYKRHEQGWVDEITSSTDEAIDMALEFQANKRARSIAYIGNIVDLWERMVERNVHVDLGSDQTSLHNPWAGGYYPQGMSYEEANTMMAEDPATFKQRIQETLKRHEQGWVDEITTSTDEAIDMALEFQAAKRARSIAYIGNIVDLWERMVQRNVHVDLGSDQTSLHNPWAGGYYPQGMSYEESNEMMATNPEEFKVRIQATLKRHVKAVNALVENGMYFFDYGNAFLLESSRAGAEIMDEDGELFRYPSYVQDIMGPMCFDYGFGPFRWVCASGDGADLDKTDAKWTITFVGSKARRKTN